MFKLKLRKTKNHKHLSQIFFFGIMSLVMLFSLSFFHIVKSSSLDNVHGYAWNAYQNTLPGEPAGGMGWLSFNSADCDVDNNGFVDNAPCDGNNAHTKVVNYGVNVDETTGDITGYAWSSNYGWLKFGGLAGQTIDSANGGMVSSDAKLNNDNTVSGWARFCAAAADQANCTGTVKNLKNGGWDGWVRLTNVLPSGSNVGVVYNPTTKEFSGYGYGGGDGQNFVGWISFNCSNGNDSCASVDYKVKYEIPTNPTVLLTSNVNSVPTNGSVTLSWSGANLASGNSCVGTESGPASTNWPGQHTSPTGILKVGPLPTGSYDFSIQCAGISGGLSNISTVHIISGGSSGIDFYATPNAAYPGNNYQVTLTWSAIPAGNLTSCVASSTPTVGSWSGSVADSLINNPASQIVDVPANPTTYHIQCLNGSGILVNATISVPRALPPEYVALSNTPVVDHLTNISWHTQNVVPGSCHPSSSPTDVTSWTSSDTSSSSGTTNAVDVPAGANNNTTYTLTCVGVYSGKDISASITLNEGSGSTFTKKQPKYIEK